MRHAQSPAILYGFSAHDFQARKITLVGLALALMLRGQKFCAYSEADELCRARRPAFLRHAQKPITLCRARDPRSEALRLAHAAALEAVEARTARVPGAWSTSVNMIVPPSTLSIKSRS